MVVWGASRLPAAPLFQAEASNGLTTVSESDPAVLELITRAVRREGEFAALIGTNFTANITFLGVPNTIRIDLNASGTIATLRIPSINFTQNFAGLDEDDLRERIRDFLKRDGAEVVARLTRATRPVSAASVTDGNPDSNTASAARAVFFTQGLTPASALVFSAEDEPVKPGRAILGVAARTAEMDIAGQDYTATQLRLSGELFDVRISDRVRLELPITADYMEIEDSEIYGAGAFLALPIRVMIQDVKNALGWRLTPVAGGQTRVSFDAVSGAVTWHAGLVSALDYRIHSRLIVSLINQATYHQGLPISLEGFTFESDVHQLILKNGVQLMTPLGRRSHAGVYYVRTEFTNEAAIDGYHTAGVTSETRLGASWSAGLTCESDWADGYQSLAARVQTNWRW